MIDYFFVDSGVHAWNPRDTSDRQPFNSDYFGEVFASMERHLGKNKPSLRVFLTGKIDRLPEYGQDIVAVVIGDECGRPPLYTQDVGVTFKCYGITPQWEAQELSLSPLNRGRVANSLRNVARSIPYIAWKKAKTLGRKLKRKSVSSVYEIPLGYNNQIDLPMKPFREREIDVFFAGTVESKPESLFSIRRWIPPPKTSSRREMVQEVRKLSRANPTLECRIEVAESPDEDSFLDREEYSSLLMNSKICLVPRGNNVETWRFFEAMRYGCIVITEKLPDRWYYEGAPIFEINKWEDAAEKVKTLMNDDSYLRNLHEKTSNWWDVKCSGEGVGKFIANRIEKKSCSRYHDSSDSKRIEFCE